ncbi:hypothetical protein [Lignipirellula cremea]|uniref:DUF4139 domain-containing protein n=1 Tax=Lignipirellula cremea TaxID=2528010 RepID=A0A518E207_9BACT|nr:hypothetical protein [Lignipirellula cremea]QDU98103.1 hypothetical protein Pla8534_59640 [Lignipirellula cremea]
MSENRIVIYSNGIADYQRSYTIAADTSQPITIPVRQDHLADLLASFNVYGDVRLKTPPTFRPANELEGNLRLNPASVYEDLATRLSGARVYVEKAGKDLEGVLLGLHEESEAGPGEPIQTKSLVVLTDDGLRRCPLREIRSWRFLDEEVQKEIDKALQRNYQRIKPKSSFVEFVLQAGAAAAEAVVQYALPAAAWKISYRLRMAEGQPTELQGFAIVDNNTEEDWIDFRVGVVTGEPITFSTDLADSKTPGRTHVDLVQETALGAVEVEMSVMMSAPADGDAMLAASTQRRKSAPALARAPQAAMKSAETAAAEVYEAGDFSVFESKDLVTLPARRSAAIPVFQIEVAEARSVLHYKQANHASRPYRSIEFTHQAAFSLSRGVCTVFEKTAYAGNCIIPSLKPGETRLLPHALETGVLVQCDPRRQRSTVVAIRLADGVCYTSTRLEQEKHYHVQNARDQRFQLTLDHTLQLTEPDITCQRIENGAAEPLAIASKLEGGVRLELAVEPLAKLSAAIVETQIRQSSVQLISERLSEETRQMAWIWENLIATNGPLAEHQGVLACLETYRELDAHREQMQVVQADRERLATRQERIRENLKTAGQDELTSRWRNELDEAERAINQIEDEKLPALQAAETALRKKLTDGLRALSVEWSKP